MADQEVAVIVGTGTGLSASLARLFNQEGMQVALAARDIAKLDDLVRETGGKAYKCDALEGDQVDDFFDSVTADYGVPSVVVYNASARVRGPFIEVDRADVRNAILVSAYAGFLVAQKAAQAMVEAGRGTILLTGASAGVKGYPQSAAFAMGKFGLRGLAQSMARELHPQNVHVAHIVIDGGIANAERGRTQEPGEERLLEPDAIAQSYLQLYRQHRSAWSWEIEVRPWTEKF